MKELSPDHVKEHMNEDKLGSAAADHTRTIKHPSGICNSLQNRGYYGYFEVAIYSTSFGLQYYGSFSDAKDARYLILRGSTGPWTSLAGGENSC